MKTTPNYSCRKKIAGSWLTLPAASLLAFGAFFFTACSSDAKKETASTEQEVQLADEPADATATAPAETSDAGTGASGKGVGPVKEVNIAGLDAGLATQGKALFEAKCSACHQVSDQKVVGPGLKGVTERREPEWIMNMILNPAEMTQKDPTAKKLLAEHLTQMTNQDVNEKDARALLEYFRQNDGAK